MHTHDHPTLSHRRMGVVVALTLTVVVLEIIVGIKAQSLAVLSDAGHNFADAIAMLSSWYAMWMAGRSPNPKRTFGYHRSGIIAAFINALILVLMALWIWWEAYQRFKHPPHVAGEVMIAMAGVALVMNLFNSYLLFKAAQSDLNIRSAFMHAVGDAVTAFGIIIAGIALLLTGKVIIDTMVSFAVGGFILWSSLGILRDSVNVLMEGTPNHINVKNVEQTLRALPDIEGIHDLHIWTIASNIVSCSVHIVIKDQRISEARPIMVRVMEALQIKFGITHTTLQIEVAPQGEEKLFCEMFNQHRPVHRHDDDHHH